MSYFRRHAILLTCAGLLTLAVAGIYLALLADLPDPMREAGQMAAPSILITDRDGRLLYEAIDPNGSKYIPLPLAEIPLACRQATIATEDSRFYSHAGVDLVAIGRAAWQNWRAGGTISGGSTLTQQVARNLFLSDGERVERSLRRKLREAWLAWRLEQRHSKDELLALYLNTTYYGHFAIGIEAAAQAYFGSHASELDLAQCALLAGLPQYPAGYNPIENPEAARYRQQVVLALMAHDGYVNQSQMEAAGRERLAYASTPFPIEAPHFVSWVQAQLEDLLAAEVLRSGGLRVVTTLDLDWQHQAEAIIRRRLAQLQPCEGQVAAIPALRGVSPTWGCDPSADPARRVDNAALVALDPRTGAVLAMVGSPDFFDPSISGAVNAALSLRQPGSAIKPLTYATAFDPERAARAGKSAWTAATLIADVRTVFPTAEGQPYVPGNYDLTFHGPVLARAALANSYNVPAVKALAYVGVEALVETAAKLGIPWQQDARYGLAGVRDLSQPSAGVQMEEADSADTTALTPASGFGLALTLGGGEVRLLDLTAAYAAFANGGRRAAPFGITRVETLDGHVLFVGSSSSTQALDPRVAYLISDILSDETARLPTFGARSVLELGRPAAAKTGTTTDWRDNWTLGFTPDLVTGVWVGNADNTPMQDVSGVTGAGPIWHDFMSAVLRTAPPSSFPRPDGLVRVEVCADSGLLPFSNAQRPANAVGVASAGRIAQDSGRTSANLAPVLVPCPHRRFEWFIAGTEPTQVDQSHVRVAVDVRSGGPADPGTPAQHLVYETVWRVPAELSDWARENGIAQPALDGTTAAWLSGGRPASGHATSASPVPDLSLASPDPNRVFRLDPRLPVAMQKLAITARPGPDLAAQGQAVSLLLDGVAFAIVFGPDYTAWWPLSRGQHVWQAIASQPDGTPIASKPVVIVVE